MRPLQKLMSFKPLPPLGYLRSKLNWLGLYVFEFQGSLDGTHFMTQTQFMIP